MKIEIYFSKLSWHLFFRPLFLIPTLIGIFALYWFWIVRPYLEVDDARLSALYQDVRTDQMGRIASAPFEEGDNVRQGQVLFSLNNDEGQKQQENLRASVKSLQKILSYHMASLDQATSSYITARKEVDLGLSTSDRCEQSLLSLQEEQSKVNQCKKELGDAEEQLKCVKDQAQQKAIQAPFSGVIVKRQKRKGDVVQFGEVIYSICDPSQVWVEAIVPEKQISKISLQQKAFIRLRADEHREWKGTISWISPMASSSGEGVPIRIALDEKEDAFLRPNLSATVKIKIH